MLYVHFSVAVDLCNSVTDVELLTVSVCPPKSALKTIMFQAISNADRFCGCTVQQNGSANQVITLYIHMLT